MSIRVHLTHLTVVCVVSEYSRKFCDLFFVISFHIENLYNEHLEPCEAVDIYICTCFSVPPV